jgi:hypothetical protein
LLPDVIHRFAWGFISILISDGTLTPFALTSQPMPHSRSHALPARHPENIAIVNHGIVHRGMTAEFRVIP